MNFYLLMATALSLFCSPKEIKPDKYLSDYLQSGYYQEVYLADIEVLKGEHTKAYQHLQAAEKKGRMLNMMGYYEIEKYIPLLLEDNKLLKALHYIKRLISEEGYTLQEIENLPHFNALKTIHQWDSIYQSLRKAEAMYVSDTAIFLQFLTLEKRDQHYRQQANQPNLTHAERQANWETYKPLQKVEDSINYYELLSIINDLFSSHIKLSPAHKGKVFSTMYLLINHNTATDSIRLMELSPLLLANLREGAYFPALYGMMIDSHRRGRKLLYGTYQNRRKPEHIEDFEHLDERRISIGLPPLAVEKEKEAYTRTLFGN